MPCLITHQKDISYDYFTSKAAFSLNSHFLIVKLLIYKYEQDIKRHFFINE